MISKEQEKPHVCMLYIRKERECVMQLLYSARVGANPSTTF